MQIMYGDPNYDGILESIELHGVRIWLANGELHTVDVPDFDYVIAKKVDR